jgi:hypothetical protein
LYRFTALAGMCCLHPRAASTLVRRGLAVSGFRLQPKRNRGSITYIAAVLSMATLALAFPSAEEFVRCFKVDRTILPRP